MLIVIAIAAIAIYASTTLIGIDEKSVSCMVERETWPRAY